MKQVITLMISLICASTFTEVNGQSYYTPISDVLKNDQLLAGSYELPKDFFYNFPSRRDSIVLTFVARERAPWVGTFKVIPRYASSGERVRRCWGFSTGKEAFIFHQIEFFPIETDGEGNLFFYGYEIIDDWGERGAAVAGGLTGALIHKATTEARAKKSRVRYTINDAGDVIHPGSDNIAGPAPVLKDIIVYRSKKKETNTAIQFLVDDKYLYSFVPGSYLQKQYSDSEKAAKICIGENFDQCISADLAEEGRIWFRITQSEEGVKPILEQVEDVDMYEVKKAADKQDKRGVQEPVGVLE